jgi:hypothetical protein
MQPSIHLRMARDAYPAEGMRTFERWSHWLDDTASSASIANAGNMNRLIFAHVVWQSRAHQGA